jgi:hypothetical protein
MDDYFWDSLIDKIRENNVVPVLGSRLYVSPDGVRLQARVAERLFQASRVAPTAALTPFHEVHEAVSILKTKLSPQRLYDAVHDAIRKTLADPGFKVPTAIEQLAKITDFRLLVTLTPDDLLLRCLRQERERAPGLSSDVEADELAETVVEILHSPTLPTSEARDLPLEWQARSRQSYLLYLFGKARSAPTFAIHDEDVLEYAHNIIARGSQTPTRFFDELQQRNLLLIGCNFGDWLSRFFLRATNRQRLLANASKFSWLVEPLEPEESLTCFLRAFNADTEIVSELPPVEFVAELYRRWRAKAALAAPESPAPERALFFVSYSRTDSPLAHNLCDVLRGLGVRESELWFDRIAVQPGMNFDDRIKDGIRTCRYFLPLLSQGADQRGDGVFLDEWRAANARAQDEQAKGLGKDLILPIVLDSAYSPNAYGADPVTAWRSIDFGHAPGGVPDERLKNQLKHLIRQSRLER